MIALAMLLLVLWGLRYRQKHGAKDPQLSAKKRGGTLSVFRIGLELLRLRGIPPDLDQVKLISLDLTT